MSDGVTDNLDPELLGVTPKQTAHVIRSFQNGHRPHIDTHSTHNAGNDSLSLSEGHDSSTGRDDSAANVSDYVNPMNGGGDVGVGGDVAMEASEFTPDRTLSPSPSLSASNDGQCAEAEWASVPSERAEEMKKTFVECLLFDIVTHASDRHTLPQSTDDSFSLPLSLSSLCLCFYCTHYSRKFPSESASTTPPPPPSPTQTSPSPPPFPSPPPPFTHSQLTPRIVVESVLRHCRCVTDPGRIRMEKNEAEKLPNDYERYPGKMDHTTCVCLTVGENDEGGDFGLGYDGNDVEGV